ncbi:universal stress protein [Vibrio maerlii]|uniref:universal stress protein n=1 Tax=Vibrio maerlii TaxID=2231648 RepID=UPI000E3D28C9|nr:universal stress protein [Vibrio maerlii]
MKYHNILVALDLEDSSKQLVRKAGFLAEQFGANVSFVHIDDTHGEIYPELIDILHIEDEAPINIDALQQLESFVEYATYPVKNCWVGTGDLSTKVLDMIADRHIDFIICGHHHDFLSKWISHSKHLIDKSPVDILVVPV